MLDLLQKARRPEETQSLPSSEKNPQNPIEATEMIEVSMRDEDVTQAQNLASTELMQVAQVEEEGPLLEHKLDEEARIAKGIVNELRMEEAIHN